MINRRILYLGNQLEDMVLCENSLYDYEDDEAERGCLSPRWQDGILVEEEENNCDDEIFW